MKRSSKELKKNARELLFGHYGLFIGSLVIYSLITTSILFSLLMFVQADSLSSFLITQLTSLIFSVLAAGFNRLALCTARGQRGSLGDLFYCFSHHPDRVIVVTLLTSLITGACLLPTYLFSNYMIMPAFSSHGLRALILLPVLLVLAIGFGILAYVITLSFTLSIPLLIDNPELGAIKAMRTSARLMKGNKWRYFCLTLSFIGLELLAALSFGIAFLWLFPYMTMTYIELYRDIIGELDGAPFSANDDHWESMPY